MLPWCSLLRKKKKRCTFRISHFNSDYFLTIYLVLKGWHGRGESLYMAARALRLSAVFTRGQAAPLCRRFFQFPLIRIIRRTLSNPIFNRPIVFGMASNESQACGSPLAHTITLPTGDTLPIVAAPGVSDSDLRFSLFFCPFLGLNLYGACVRFYNSDAEEGKFN